MEAQTKLSGTWLLAPGREGDTLCEDTQCQSQSQPRRGCAAAPAGAGAGPAGPTGLFAAGGCHNTPCHRLNSRRGWDVLDREHSCRGALLLQVSLQGFPCTLGTG